MTTKALKLRATVVLLLAVIALAAIPGCVEKDQGPQAEPPLQTKGETAPPPGCQDLRKRGGSC